MGEDRKAGSDHVGQLDGLRGLLALWVTVSHIVCWTGWAELYLYWKPHRIWRMLIYSEPAVDTFIILSGFAISFLLNERKPSYRTFIIGRFFRLYPVYLICLALGLATIYVTPTILNNAPWGDTVYFRLIGWCSAEERQQTLAHMSAHLMMMQGVYPYALLPDSTATILTPSWSISLEWQYYLAAPFIARLIRSPSGVLFAGLVAWLGIRYGEIWMNPHSAFLPTQLPLFFIGIYSYHYYARQKALPEEQRGDFAFISAVLLAISCVVSWHSFALAIWAIGFGSIRATGDDMYAKALRSVRSLLIHPRLKWLGAISYPLYLVHWPMILVLMHFMLLAWPTVTPQVAFLVMLCAGLPVILGCAYVIHRTVELPAMAYSKRLARSRQLLADQSVELSLR